MASGTLEISGKERIVAAIRSRGLTLGALDRRLGLPIGACSAAVNKPYHKAELAISRFLDVPARTLWPDRYDSDGTRKRPQPAANYRPKRRFAGQQ